MSDLPREIGGYEIQRVLGSGGMATVYAALQKQPRRTVAIKVLRAVDGSEAAARRFRREIEILGRLRHPNIAQVYAADVHDTYGPYFVMEYIPRARTIVEHATANKLAQRDVLKLFLKVCAAVGHGHHAKVVHLDLKPGNILIDETGEPKIIDFGIAHAASTESIAGRDDAAALGTLHYMAPEQLDEAARDLDARCDVWALGVLLYRLLTGRPPHELSGIPVPTAARLIREEPPPRPGTLDKSLRGDLEAIILKAMTKDRAKRYRTAGSLGRDVLRYLTQRPVHARSNSVVHRLRLTMRRRRREFVVGGVGLVLVAAALGVAAMALLRDRGAAANVDRSATSSPGGDAVAPTAPRDTVPETPGALPMKLTLHEQTVREVRFDDSGEHLVSLSVANEVAVWDVRRAELIFVTKDHAMTVAHAAFDGLGARLATAANEDDLLITDVVTARVVNRIRPDCGAVSAIDFARQGDRIAVACGDLTVRVLGVPAGESARTDVPLVLRGSSGAFSMVAFSHNGEFVAAGSERGRLVVWDVPSGAPRLRCEGLVTSIIAISFDERDGQVRALARDGQGASWSLDGDGRVPDGRFSVLLSDVSDAGFDATGDWVAAVADNRFQVVNARTGAAVSPPVTVADIEVITSVAVTADGRRIAIGGTRGEVRIVASDG